MASNQGVAYIKPGTVELQSIDYPKLELGKRQCHHGVILKIISTNICGSDQHMVRGRTTAPAGLILGHEITGEVIEAGRDVEFIAVGDIVSVPFNIACGRCRNCKEGKTGICLSVNPARPGWIHAQADPRFSLFAVSASATGDIEGDRNDIAHRDELDVPTGFDHFARNLVTQD